MQWWIEESLKDEQYKKHHNCTKKVTIAKSNYNMNTYNIDNCLQHDKKKLGTIKSPLMYCGCCT